MVALVFLLVKVCCDSPSKGDVTDMVYCDCSLLHQPTPPAARYRYDVHVCHVTVLSSTSQHLQQHFLSLSEGGCYRHGAGDRTNPHHEHCSLGGTRHHLPAHARWPHQVPSQRGGEEGQGRDDSHLPLSQPWPHLDHRLGTCGRDRCVDVLAA